MIEVESLTAFLASWQQGQSCCWQPAFGQRLEVTLRPAAQLTLTIEGNVQHSNRLRELLQVRYQQPGRFARCFIAADQNGALILVHTLFAGDDLQSAIQLLMALNDSQSS